MIKTNNKRLFAELMLVLVAMAWGLGFPIMKDALASYSVLSLLWLRFSLAAILMAPFAINGIQTLGRKGVLRGMLLGILLFLSFSFLIMGLKLTTASNTGFLSGLCVIWVPLLAGPLLGKPPGTGVKIGAALGVIGLFFISGGTLQNIQTGDILVIVGSVCTALHILGIDCLTKNSNGWALTFIQIVTMAVLALVASLLLDPYTIPRDISYILIRTLVITSVFTTIFAFWAQTSFQRWTTPARAAVVYNLEPLFSAIFAVSLLGETISSRAWVGGGIIFLGMIVTEYFPWFQKSNIESTVIVEQ